MRQPNKKSQKQTKPWYKKWWGITLIVIFALTVLSATASEDQSKKQPTKQTSQQTQEQKQPQYEIKIAGSHYVDPATRSLTFTVKNVSDVEGNPSCDVTLQNDTGTYKGFDTVTWNTPLKPGETKYFEGNFIITNEGAAYATKSHVRCIERSI